MALSDVQRALYQLMVADNNAAGAPFAPSEFWQNESTEFEKTFEEFGINDIENEYYNTRFSGLSPKHKSAFHLLLITFYRMLQARDYLGLLTKLSATAPVVTSPEYYRMTGAKSTLPHAMEFDGRRISIDLLLSIHEFYSMLAIVPELATEELTIAELGAGWGRLAHVMLQVNPRLHYLIMDIPASLLVSASHLPRLLPELSVAGYPETRKFATLSRAELSTHQLWLCGSQALRALRPGAIDLFLQVGGFQEMLPAQTNAYLQLVDAAMPQGTIYLKNAWHGVRTSYNQLQLPSRWLRVMYQHAEYCDDFYELGFKLLPAGRSRESYQGDLVAGAQADLNAGRPRLALAKATQLTVLMPDAPGPVLLLAAAYLKVNPQRALAVARKGLEQWPQDTRFGALAAEAEAQR